MLGFNPLSQNPLSSLPVAEVTVVVQPELGWLVPISQPTRPKSSRHVHAALSWSPINIVVAALEDLWLVPLSEPVRARDGRYIQEPRTVLGHYPLVSFSWMNGLSQPTRRQSRVPVGAPSLHYQADPVVSFSWFAPLPDRLLNKNRNAQQLFASQVFPETSVDIWLPPLSLPERPRRGVHQSHGLQWTPFDLVVVDDGVTVDSWYSALGLPMRGKSRTQTSADFAWTTLDYVGVAETITMDKWYTPLSLPKHRFEMPRASLSASVSFQPKPVVPFGWYARLTEPKRSRELPRATGPASITFQDDPIVPFEWFESLREPVRRVPRLRSGAEPQLSFALLETLVAYRWFMPLQEPVRPKDKRHIQQHYVLARPPIVPFEWHVQTNEPPRRVKPHPSRHGVAAATITGTLHPLIFTAWYAALAEPVRRNRTVQHIPDWLRDGIPYYDVFLNVSHAWYRNLDLPTRPLPRLDATQQPAENTTYLKGNLPFKTTGPLYLNGRATGAGQAFWRGRTTR